MLVLIIRNLLKLTVILVPLRLELQGRACKVLLETEAFIFTPEKPNKKKENKKHPVKKNITW